MVLLQLKTEDAKLQFKSEKKIYDQEREIQEKQLEENEENKREKKDGRGLNPQPAERDQLARKEMEGWDYTFIYKSTK